MIERTTPNQRGLALEQRLERLFRAKGYDVRHDVWLRGRSGAQHQIDVVADFSAPLHTSRVLVEAKSYQGAVDKDRIMKLIQIVADVGADRGIIITTSRFTPDAIKSAAGYNIDLWDREKLGSRLGEIEIASVEGTSAAAVAATTRGRELVVALRVDAEQLRVDLARATERRARGVLGIGRVVERLIEVVAIDYPYYEATLSVDLEETQRVGLFRRETIRKTATTTLSFDAATGAIVEPAAAGITYELDWMPALTADEITIMRDVNEDSFSWQSLAAFGITEARTKRAIASLQAKRLIERTDTKPVSYRRLRSFPGSAESIVAISNIHECLGCDSQMETAGITTLIEPAAIVRAVELYWPGSAAQDVRLLYYPYICARYDRADGSGRSETFDAVTGKPNEAVNRLMQPRLVASDRASA